MMEPTGTEREMGNIELELLEVELLLDLDTVQSHSKAMPGGPESQALDYSGPKVFPHLALIAIYLDPWGHRLRNDRPTKSKAKPLLWLNGNINQN